MITDDVADEVSIQSGASQFGKNKVTQIIRKSFSRIKKEGSILRFFFLLLRPLEKLGDWRNWVIAPFRPPIPLADCYHHSALQIFPDAPNLGLKCLVVNCCKLPEKSGQQSNSGLGIEVRQCDRSL